jgi:hypothetical protein
MRSRHNLPPDIEALFTKTPPIQDVIELALGDQGTYFVSYRDHDNQILAKHYNLPNALTSYLYHSQPNIIRDLATLSITLGPFESYYAWDISSASWNNLPPKLEKSVLNRLESQDAQRTVWKANGAEAPSFVSLGADEAYWMRTVSGGGCWDLKCSSTDDGMAGMRGINTFLEESNNFGGIAVSFFFSQHTIWLQHSLTKAGRSSFPIPFKRLHSYHNSRQSLLQLTRVHMGRLQQDGTSSPTVRTDHAADSSFAAASPATTTAALNACGTHGPVTAANICTSALSAISTSTSAQLLSFEHCRSNA